MGFFSSLFGDDQRDDLRRAKRRSDRELEQGYDEARGLYEQGYGDAQGYYDRAYGELTPYAQGGRRAQDTYTQALGLGTQDQRREAQGLYFDDPAWQSMMDEENSAMMRYLNARGQSGGGRANLAAARVARQGYGNWLNRMSQLGQQGGQYAAQQSGIRAGQGDQAMNYGMNMGNLRYGYAGTKAGNEINFGNAMAQSRNTGLNNLLNIAGTGAKVAGSIAAFSDIRLKRDIERVGELLSGLPVYTFRYYWSDQPYQGVIAQEAMHYAPHAVSQHGSGYLVVDYAAL